MRKSGSKPLLINDPNAVNGESSLLKVYDTYISKNIKDGLISISFRQLDLPVSKDITSIEMAKEKYESLVSSIVSTINNPCKITFRFTNGNSAAKNIKSYISEYELRLKREQSKSSPDALKVDKYQKTIAFYKKTLEENKSKYAVCFMISSTINVYKHVSSHEYGNCLIELERKLNDKFKTKLRYLKGKDNMLSCYKLFA